MKFRPFYLLGLAMAAALALPSCMDRKPSVSATLYCDDSFRNIIQQEIDIFEYRLQNNHILPTYTSQKEAIEALFAKEAQIIVIGRDLTPDEKKRLENMNLKPRSQKIAVDAVALIVNEENPVDRLSMKEISAILTGETQRWEDVQPDGMNRRINVILDNEGSSLAYFMQDSFLNGKKFGPNVSVAGSVDSVLASVKKDPANIGVIGVTWLTADLDLKSGQELSDELKNDTTAVNGLALNEAMDNAGVKTIGVMRDMAVPYRPYQQNIYDGTYPLTRPIYMVTTSTAGVPSRFYAFVGGVDGQRLIMRTGVLPARVPIDIYEIKTAE